MSSAVQPTSRSIVPATGFYWLLGRMLDTMASRRTWLLPSNLAMQPGDSAEFADYVVECARDGPRGDRVGFGGPETLTLVEMARQYEAARGISRRVLGVPLPGFVQRAAGPQVCPGGHRGTTTWGAVARVGREEPHCANHACVIADARPHEGVTAHWLGRLD